MDFSPEGVPEAGVADFSSEGVPEAGVAGAVVLLPQEAKTARVVNAIRMASTSERYFFMIVFSFCFLVCFRVHEDAF